MWAGFVGILVIWLFFIEAKWSKIFGVTAPKNNNRLYGSTSKWTTLCLISCYGFSRMVHRQIIAALSKINQLLFSPKKWIGRQEAIEWPAKSSDLTSLDYILRGYLKPKICAICLDLEDLKRRKSYWSFSKCQIMEVEISNNVLLIVSKYLVGTWSIHFKFFVEYVKK